MPGGYDGINLSLRFPDHQPIGALDLSSFLFDLNRLYVISYKGERDPDWLAHFRGYGRGSFRLPKNVQLRVNSFRFESPLLIIFGTAFAAAPAIWAMLQVIEKVQLWPLQKKKLLLDIEKVGLEVLKLRHEVQPLNLAREDLSENSRSVLPDGGWRLAALKAERQRIEPLLEYPITTSAVKHLAASPLKPTELNVDVNEPEITGFGLARRRKEPPQTEEEPPLLA